MIIGKNRSAVVAAIQKALEEGDLHRKVEQDDPVLTPRESRAILNRFLEERKDLTSAHKHWIGTLTASCAAKILTRKAAFVGTEQIPRDLGGVIITSNHFSQLENLLIRRLSSKIGKRRLGIVCQVNNLAMTGPVGFLMNYADTVPVAADSHYLARDFFPILRERLCEKKDAVLIYPEQEMWFRYRKPRPPKSGAYFYAAKLNVPVLSCFVEMREGEKDDTEEFKKITCTVHVLGLLYPDPKKGVRENTDALARRDYELKKACYESVYGKKLTYAFEPSDIAGWKGAL